MTEPKEIHTFLNHFNLIEYESALREAGLENLQIIKQLQNDDINELIADVNIKQYDINKFKNAINAVKNDTYNSNKKEAEFKYEYKKIKSSKQSDVNNNKTIMFIGESGVGKTTAINSMCNYLYNVKYNNKFRYKLINENEKKEHETKSQTQNINKYYLNSKSKNLSQINYSLTIIDTPG
eukprot:273891_1